MLIFYKGEWCIKCLINKNECSNQNRAVQTKRKKAIWDDRHIREEWRRIRNPPKARLPIQSQAIQTLGGRTTT